MNNKQLQQGKKEIQMGTSNKQIVEINIKDIHCTITFLKEDNPSLKDNIIRILSDRSSKRIQTSDRHNH